MKPPRCRTCHEVSSLAPPIGPRSDSYFYCRKCKVEIDSEGFDIKFSNMRIDLDAAVNRDEDLEPLSRRQKYRQDI